MSAERDAGVRAAGEKTRLVEQVARFRALLHGLELTLQLDVPALESATAVAEAGIRIATTAARYDAFLTSKDRTP